VENMQSRFGVMASRQVLSISRRSRRFAGQPVASAVASEQVLFRGFDGATAEYCPYTETSKSYDQTRAPLGLNIVLGSMCALRTPMTEQKLLDIGCGTGTFLESVQGRTKHASGLEYNDGMIAEARKRLGERVEVLQGSADKLPYEACSFDVCTIHQVIHHFPKEKRYQFAKRSFEEAYRVLKTGGVFIINTSMPEQQRDAFWWLSLFPGASDAICDRFPPMVVLQDHLKAAGFVLDADSVAVPLHRTLMVEDKYLEHGVKSAFIPSYRAGDSSWSMAENSGELEDGLRRLQAMIDDGSADAWLEEREALRMELGQATFIIAQKL